VKHRLLGKLEHGQTGISNNQTARSGQVLFSHRAGPQKSRPRSTPIYHRNDMRTTIESAQSHSSRSSNFQASVYSRLRLQSNEKACARFSARIKRKTDELSEHVTAEWANVALLNKMIPVSQFCVGYEFQYATVGCGFHCDFADFAHHPFETDDMG